MKSLATSGTQILSSKPYDAIIVGGGHNGLVAAGYLAKAGKRVLVLERRSVMGGAAVTEEVFPGFKFSVCSYVVSLFRPQIIRDLELVKHGFELIPLDCSFLPLPEGRGLCRWPDPARSREEVSVFSRKDAEIYPEFGAEMSRMARLVKGIIDRPAPDPFSNNPKEAWDLLRVSRELTDMGDEAFYTHLKLLTMSALEFLDQWFESDVLKAPMSVSGIIGTFLGVRSPGTAYVLLHHYMGEIDGAFRAWGFHKGGTGGVSLALANAAESFGAEIVTDAEVSRFLNKNGTVSGVVLKSGAELKASVVISALDPRATYLKLLEPSDLDPEFRTKISQFKFRGSSGKVNLALDRVPEFKCRPGDGPHIRGDIAIAPGTAYLERAYDDAKAGNFSKRPYINVVIPTLSDPTLAPPGKHVLSAFVQYAPYHLKEGPEAWPDARDAFGKTVVDTLEEYIPGLRSSILHQQTLTPWDIEKMVGLSEGNIFQGELSLEQLLFFRPVAGASRYSTPLKRLWMCGSGTHPGGGIMGACGELAAKALLRSREL